MFGLITYSAIFGALTAWSYKRNAVALTAIICMFSLEQWGQASSSFFLTNNTFTNVAIGTLVLFVIIKKFLSSRLYFRVTATSLAVYLLYMYSFISLVWSPNDSAIDLWIFMIPYLITIIIFGPLLVNNSLDVNHLSKSLIWVGVPLAFLLLNFVEWKYRSIVIQGTTYENSIFGNPLEVATFASFIFIAVSFQDFTKTSALRIISSVLIGILSIALIITSGSRGQLLATILVAFILLPIKYNIKNIGVFLFLGIFLAVLLGTVFYLINQFGDGNYRWDLDQIQKDILGRFDASYMMIDSWISSGLNIIVGLGNSSSYTLIGTYPHNVLVEVFCEEGLIGGFMYLFILFNTIRIIKKIVKFTKKRTTNRDAITLLAGFFLFAFIISLKQGSLIGNYYFFMFAIIIARLEIDILVKPRNKINHV